jgi:DtxR family Mn-dependent transcriptional regulator
VPVHEVAKRLGISSAEAAHRITALHTAGLATREGDNVLLTAAGEGVALRLVRRHRVLERFLTDVLALPWERVHEEAERLTPVMADDVTDGLARLCGEPATCPHGNPIPSENGALVTLPTQPLSDVPAGRHVVISLIEREEPELLRYLAALGLLPETAIEVEEVGPLGGPVLVRVAGSRYALGRNVAARIRVREA